MMWPKLTLRRQEEAQVQREKVLLELSPARKSRHPHAEAPPGRPAPSYGVPKEG